MLECKIQRYETNRPTPLPALAAACGPGSHLSESPETSDASDGPATPPVETVTPLSRVELTDAEKARVESGNVFAFKLLQKVYAEQQASVVLSPLSVQYALGMVNNGASGETEQQISAVLGQEGRADLNAFCRHLLSDLPRVDTTVTLSIANGILLNNDYTMKPAFQQAVEENYDALVETMPFANPNAVVSRVNGWCSEKTRGKIPQILSDVSPDAILFALNAIYFKGSWRDAFNAKYTREQDFRTAGGGTTPVQMMHREGKFSYGENDHFQRLALPYGNGRFAMEVFLPKGDLAECLEYMKNTPWSELKKGSSPGGDRQFPPLQDGNVPEPEQDPFRPRDAARLHGRGPVLRPGRERRREDLPRAAQGPHRGRGDRHGGRGGHGRGDGPAHGDPRPAEAEVFHRRPSFRLCHHGALLGRHPLYGCFYGRIDYETVS